MELPKKFDPLSAVETLRALIAGSTQISGALIRVHSKNGSQIVVQNGDVLRRSELLSQGASLKLLNGMRVSEVNCDRLDSDALKELVVRGLNELRDSGREDVFEGAYPCEIPESGFEFKQIDEQFSQIHLDEKINRLLNLESSLLKVDRRADQSFEVNYEDSLSEDFTWTTGSEKVLRHSMTQGTVGAGVSLRENGQESKGFAQHSATQYFDLDWSGVLREAVQQAVKPLLAEPVQPGLQSVLFSAPVMAQFLGFFANAFYADRNESAQCFLTQHLGKKIFSDLLHIYDDPTAKKSIFTRIWDAEGTPTQRRPFVSAGVFHQFCHSRRTARRDDVSPTGHYLARDFFQPQIGFHNLMIEPGRKDFVDLVREIQKGVIAYRIDSVDELNFRSGTFRFLLSGTEVVNGQEIRPVNQIVLAGNFIDTFNRMVAVGRDNKSQTNISSPSILFGNLELSRA